MQPIASPGEPTAARQSCLFAFKQHPGVDQINIMNMGLPQDKVICSGRSATSFLQSSDTCDGNCQLSTWQLRLYFDRMDLMNLEVLAGTLQQHCSSFCLNCLALPALPFPFKAQRCPKFVARMRFGRGWVFRPVRAACRRRAGGVPGA